jgi:hypothetical protein
MKEAVLGNILAEVVNNNPGYDGLKKKAVFVPHEGNVYHGFVWSKEDYRVMAENKAWQQERRKMPDSDIRANSDYAMSMPPTLAQWLFDQPQWKLGTAKERKLFIDKMVAKDSRWKLCQRW